MSTTLGILELTPQGSMRRSTHSAADLAGRTLGGKSLLEWVIRRTTDSTLLDQVAVVGTSAQRRLLDRLTPPDVVVVESDQADALGRLAAACRQLQAGSLVRVKLDCPFIDPELIDRLIGDANAHPGCDYVAYGSAAGGSAVQTQVGMFAEWFRGQALERADRMAKVAADREAPNRYFHSHPEQFILRLLPIPKRLDRQDLRLSIRGEEDWDHVQSILEALGPDELDWYTIADLLDQQPVMRHRMAIMNQADRDGLKD